jgi:glycosyltransferase involved in cell wall biosynthesis
LYRFLRGVVPLLRYGYTPRLSRWLKIHAKDYDAIIINGLWNYASYGSWRALRKLNTPYFVFTHGMLDPWFNKAYPIKTLFKSIYWKLFEHKVLRDARSVLFTTEEECQLAPLSFSPYIAKALVVGYGTQDIEGTPEVHQGAFLARIPEIKGRKFMLFLSRIHFKKGCDLLIKAFAIHAPTFPEIDLVMAGPDETGWTKHLKTLAEQLGVAHRIHWPGMLSGDEKWGAFRSADFFVLPSHQENFGIVVAEAMALSKPVLITNKVNIWREVEADGAGLITNDDVDAIAAGLQTMCAFSQPQLDAFGRRARQCFLARYDLRNNSLDLLMKLASATWSS